MIWKIIILISLVVIYFTIFNYALEIQSVLEEYNQTMENLTEEQIINLNAQNTRIGNSVAISIKRTRFYGMIKEDGAKKTLYFLDFIPILYSFNGTDYRLFHFIFLFSVLGFLFFVITKDIKSKKEVR